MVRKKYSDDERIAWNSMCTKEENDFLKAVKGEIERTSGKKMTVKGMLLFLSRSFLNREKSQQNLEGVAQSSIKSMENILQSYYDFGKEISQAFEKMNTILADECARQEVSCKRAEIAHEFEFQPIVVIVPDLKKSDENEKTEGMQTKIEG